MTVKSTGPLSFGTTAGGTNIGAEYLDTQPYSMSEFRRGGGKVPSGGSANVNIPTTLTNMKFSQFYGSTRNFSGSLVVSGNVNNYNVKTAAIAAGWDGVTPTNLTITINSGIVVGSTGSGSYAFDTGASLPATSTINVINNGYIVGSGGDGGNGGNQYNGMPGGGGAGSVAGAANHGGGNNTGLPGNPGLAGGPALRAQWPVSITNNGTIGGGGGGGGGAGNSNGTGADVWSTPGGLTTGGAGGPGTHYTHNGAGGKGGDLGQAGTAGSPGAALVYNEIFVYVDTGPDSGAGNGAGGAAGLCVVGNSNITWTVAGIRLGSIT